MILGKQSTAGLPWHSSSQQLSPPMQAPLSAWKEEDRGRSLTARKPTAGAERAHRQGHRAREGGRQDRQGAGSPRRDLHPEHEARPVLGQVPESDQHFLGRVDFNKIIGDQTYAVNKATSQGSGRQQAGILQALPLLLRQPRRQPAPQLPRGRLRPDAADGLQRLRPPALCLRLRPQRLPRQHPHRCLRRNAHLRQAATSAASSAASGSRPATATSSASTATSPAPRRTTSEFYHFDSWRTNVQPDLWLPTSFYVEESDPKSVSRTLKFKAINHIWGYVLKVPATGSREHLA